MTRPSAPVGPLGHSDPRSHSAAAGVSIRQPDVEKGALGLHPRHWGPACGALGNEEGRTCGRAAGTRSPWTRSFRRGFRGQRLRQWGVLLLSGVQVPHPGEKSLVTRGQSAGMGTVLPALLAAAFVVVHRCPSAGSVSMF